eukprot:scaffold2879_cov269-Prasinococcus_capsulatus_cf.AAC.8
MNANRRREQHACRALRYRVMNTFSKRAFRTSSLASSSACTSAALRRHPIAPTFSCACRTLLAPGMGMVPLHTHQLMAT